MSEKDQKVVCRSGSWWAVLSRSRAGQIYYFNCKTGEKTWDKPPTFDTNVPEPNVNKTMEELVSKSGNKFKIKTSLAKKLHNNNTLYSKPKSEDSSHKTDVKKQSKERKNLGGFAHTFHPPEKPSKDSIHKEQSPAESVSTGPPSLANSQVSLNIRSRRFSRIAQDRDSVFSEEETENKSNVPSVNSQTTSFSAPCLEPPERTWLQDVPFGLLNSSTVLDNQTINKLRPYGPLYSAKQGREKQPKNPTELNPAMHNCVKSNSGKRQPLRGGEVSVTRVPTEGRSSPYKALGTRRKSGGLGEERMRKLREQLTEELQRGKEQKRQPLQKPLQDGRAECTKKKSLLPTPPSYMKTDRYSKTDISPKEPPAKMTLPSAPSGVVRLDNSASFRKDIDNESTKSARKRIHPSSAECMKINSNSNISSKDFPGLCQNQENLASSAEDHSSNFKIGVPAGDVIPAAEVFELEAMDVDEEAEVLSHIKALRTGAVWESLDTEWTPMEMEIDAVSLDSSTSTAVVVLDTNILLTHLSFVRDLRDTLKLSGNHPFLYLPWMVLQELDRLKEGSTKRASWARAAVNFLNDSFKRKHPRVRGQTGREARRARSDHLDELCPDDNILESCLQLQDQGLHVVLFSNDVSLCNKALVHDIKAVTKIQLTNEMHNSTETNSLLHKGQSPPSEKKHSAMGRMDRLRSLGQPVSPQSITTQPVQPLTLQPHTLQPQPTQSKTKQSLILESFKNILLETFTKVTAPLLNLTSSLSFVIRNLGCQVLSTGMEAVYGSMWTKRVICKPPWELHNVFICIAKHWFALCDSTTPEPVQKAANDLKKIFQKSINQDSLEVIIDLTKEIYNRLPFKYDKILAPLEEQIEAISSGRTNLPPEENCQGTENQSNVSAVQPNIPPGDSNVMAYFGSLWNILHPFCSSVKQKLENGIVLDSDTRNHCKEMLRGTEELVRYISGVLSVPENELDIRHPGLQGIFNILRSATPPPGAEPLQLEHVFKFCIQPKERLLLFNGLSQLEDCGNVLGNAVEGNRDRFVSCLHKFHTFPSKKNCCRLFCSYYTNKYESLFTRLRDPKYILEHSTKPAIPRRSITGLRRVLK